ncbi:MAG: cupin domain-containing protein [Lactobacillus sp.]|jgi:mannose-6-phosphate isomerase-like protein (cupin superfamily)|nr:cupin domain-containing protein [Lactobacillus sp.]
MKKPFKKHIPTVEIEGAHGGAGRRQLLLSSSDTISPNIEAATKGFLAPGGIFDWHDHDNVDEVFIVLQGIGKVDFEDGTKVEYTEGDMVYMPHTMKHKITNTGSVENLFYFIRVRN